jgi:hypothetical protein
VADHQHTQQLSGRRYTVRTITSSALGEKWLNECAQQLKQARLGFEKLLEIRRNDPRDQRARLKAMVDRLRRLNKPQDLIDTVRSVRLPDSRHINITAEAPTAILPRLVKWEEVTADADHFRATPAGAVFLSGYYGTVRGTLRICDDCWRYVVFHPLRISTHCHECRKLARGGGNRLSMRSQQAWRLAADVMRKPAFLTREEIKEKGITRETLPDYKRNARTALHKVTRESQLAAWRKTWAPPGKIGRPVGRPSSSNYESDDGGGSHGKGA